MKFETKLEIIKVVLLIVILILSLLNLFIGG